MSKVPVALTIDPKAFAAFCKANDLQRSAEALEAYKASLEPSKEERSSRCYERQQVEVQVFGHSVDVPGRQLLLTATLDNGKKAKRSFFEKVQEEKVLIEGVCDSITMLAIKEGAKLKRFYTADGRMAEGYVESAVEHIDASTYLGE